MMLMQLPWLEVSESSETEAMDMGSVHDYVDMGSVHNYVDTEVGWGLRRCILCNCTIHAFKIDKFLIRFE